MKTLRTPTIVLLALWAAFVVWVNGSAGQLPATVASHFNAAGTPDGWMSRQGYLSFVQIFGLGLPLAIVAGFALSTRLPDWMVNLPHKQFWLGPGQRHETRLFLVRQSVWLSCLTLLLVAGAHGLTLLANESQPVQLPMRLFWPLLGGFLAAVAIWVLVFVRHFYRPGVRNCQ